MFESESCSIIIKFDTYKFRETIAIESYFKYNVYFMGINFFIMLD